MPYTTNIDFDAEFEVPQPSGDELDNLKSQINEFMKSKPKIEEELKRERVQLTEVSKSMNTLKHTIAENKGHLVKSKVQLEIQVNKKNELEQNVLKLEKILDLMRKEFKRIIQVSSQVTFVEPEEYKEFKKDSSQRILSLMQEKTTNITKTFKKKNQNEFVNLTHVEEKSTMIRDLVKDINQKEEQRKKQLNTLRDEHRKLEISREELKELKYYRFIVIAFCIFLVVTSALVKFKF